VPLGGADRGPGGCFGGADEIKKPNKDLQSRDGSGRDCIDSGLPRQQAGQKADRLLKLHGLRSGESRKGD